MLTLEPLDHRCDMRVMITPAVQRRHFPSGFPYGPNACGHARHHVAKWATRLGLVHGRDGSHDALKWLLRGTDNALVKRPGMRNAPADPINGSALDFADHTTGWLRGRERALLVCQPYHVTDSDRERLARIETMFPLLQVAIDRVPSWYGHGTHMIEIARRDVFPLTGRQAA